MGEIFKIQPIFIAGPTAVGKSEIALRVAEKIDGEIISVDSMQVYRGLDIGTAKPSSAELERVPHHLIDICDLTDNFDAAQFVRLAQTAAGQIQSRGKIPVFCGGTGFYFKAFMSGLGESPPASSDLRAELEVMPFESLLRELRERDPSTYGKIDKQNPRRVIRAVEVIRLTGKKFSEQRAEWKTDAKRPNSEVILVLTREQEDLRRRINARVDEMFTDGLVEETRELLRRGLAENKTAMQALGYRQVAEHLRSERKLPETIQLVKIRTWQFAKRQLTWFRRHGNCRWIELRTDESAEESAEKIATAR
jgi:tRNA dimethylallyltransferase